MTKINNQTTSYCTKVKKACLGLLRQPDIQLKIFLVVCLFVLPVVFVGTGKKTKIQTFKKSKYEKMQQSSIESQPVSKDTIRFYNFLNQYKQR